VIGFTGQLADRAVLRCGSWAGAMAQSHMDEDQIMAPR
jgi:hypothetical protein